ncbi:hypothetical protein [Cupriavidus oxalaticus]|jgi:hypothetical protein|uniref:hypothetical protein n=1 Tax=Cupriavidus oxalaticus TaxID=96344 RepID=UPI00403412F2
MTASRRQFLRQGAAKVGLLQQRLDVRQTFDTNAVQLTTVVPACAGMTVVIDTLTERH